MGTRREREKLTHREASLCISGDVSVYFRMCLSPWAFPLGSSLCVVLQSVNT